MKISKFILWILLVTAACNSINAAMSRDDSLLLFSQANQAFSKANETKNTQEAAGLYEKAILDYEKIIDQGGIKNAKLYYNLANAYVLSNNIGKAILNYRKAQLLDSSDPDIYKNLNFARSKRADTIPVSSQKKIMERLFFWHYDFSAKTRFIVGGIGFAVFCIWLTLKLWFVRWPAVKVVCTLSALLAVSMIVSLAAEYYAVGKNPGGVIIAQSVVARQGDGDNYPQSFNEPLHAGVEFETLEQRPSWLHIKLANGHDAWIPCQSSELIEDTFISCLPVYQMIRNSLVINDKRANGSAYPEDRLLLPLISSLFVWAAGMIPSLVTRLVILRRSMTKPRALIFALIFWVLNLVVLAMLGSSILMYVNFLLVSMASFVVLRISSAKYDSFCGQQQEVQQERDRREHENNEQKRQWEEEQKRWKQEADKAREEAYRSQEEAIRAKQEAEHARNEAYRQQENARKQRENCNDPASKVYKNEEYYAAVLGLDRNAGIEEAKRRYRYLASKYHPDKVHHLGDKLKETADIEMKKINEAIDFYKKKYGFK